MEPKLIKAIYLPIEPPTRTAQQKGARVVHGRIHFFEKKEVAQAKAILKDELLKFVPDESIKGPVRIDVTFAFGTKDKKKVRGEFRTTRPDLDNLFKGLADCLTDLGFWKIKLNPAINIIKENHLENQDNFIYHLEMDERELYQD